MKTNKNAKGNKSHPRGPRPGRKLFSPSADVRATPQSRSANVRKKDNAGEEFVDSVALNQILTVVYEDDHFVVLDKPALLDSQNSKPGRPSVVDWLQERFQYSGLVHRLDFGVSGLMVAAKNAAKAAELTRALQAGKIKREYLAVVLGKDLPDEGEFTNDIEGKPSRTLFSVQKRFANACLVEVRIETGRKHQIRRHFAEAKHPLLGDHLYGNQSAKILFKKRPALHAFRLTVDGRKFESKLPDDLENLIRQLK